MCGVERSTELHQQLDGPVWFKRAAFTKKLVQVGSMHEVHDQEEQPIVLAGVMDRNHIWVVQRRGNAHLALEPLPELIIVSQLRREHLQSVDPVERDIGRAVHDPHPATADQLVDAVTANNKAALKLTTSGWHFV